MGADAFHVCYGLRWDVDAAKEGEITLLEKRQDLRQIAAKTHRLDSWWGPTTEQGRYFLTVGKLVGNFGCEGKGAARIEDAELTRLMAETRRKLKAAGLEGEPAWHFEYVPDY
jgi:hypothetical protein